MVYKNYLIYATLLISSIFFNACIEPQNSFTKIPPGIWRGVLYLTENPQFAENKKEIVQKTDYNGELPFNFEVIYTDKDNFYIELINDTERIKVDDIVFTNAKSINKDSVAILFKEFDTRIEALYENSTMEGTWHVNYRENYTIKFKATHGKDYRFEPNKKPLTANFSGKWEAIFDPNTENAFPGIAVFQQNENKIIGTIETETGDYRFLEGNVYGDKAFLSCFDGSHAFLIEAKILQDGSLSGSFRSGKHYTVGWEGKRNEDATLQNAFSLAKSTSTKAVEFSLPDQNGKMVTLNDEKYKGKVKILEIMGTWCPNCKDATLYLQEMKKNPAFTNVEVVSLAFERYRDTTAALSLLNIYHEKNDLEWDILLGGYFDKKEAADKLGFLDKVVAYPTLIILDNQNVIQHVYTGFYGPATDKYESFKQEFETKLNEVISLK
jgi:thiol-disulfide isomerase/thioredoxin